jgi:hypothetical protein
MCCIVTLRRSAAASVVVSGSSLELPPQEFQQLQQLAVEGSGQIVLKLASECEAGSWMIAGTNCCCDGVRGCSAFAMLLCI